MSGKQLRKSHKVMAIHGAAGCGKTRLIENLMREFGGADSVAVLVNAVGNREDADHLARQSQCPAERIASVDVAGFSSRALGNASQANHLALESLLALELSPSVVLLEAASTESGGVFDEELVDFNIAVLDAAAGDRVAVKQAARVRAADCVVVNRCDLASQCDVSLQRIRSDLQQLRPDLSVPFLSLPTAKGLDELFILLAEHFR